MTADHGSACCFDDWARHDLRRARRRGEVDRVTSALLDALSATGLDNVTFLDVGCGAGGLALGALRRGATRASGVELGAGAVEAARTLAAEQGLSDRCRFAVADGSVDRLARHDVVALNRVICCYPRVEDLLSNTIGAAREVYAFVVPRSNGIVGRMLSAFVRVPNAWFRLRRSHYGDYQAHVHDVPAIDARLRAEGFRPVTRRHVSGVWHLAVYRREPSRRE